MFAANPCAIPGLGDGDDDVDAGDTAGDPERATGSAAGLESFWSDAGGVGRPEEACGASVEDTVPEDGKSDGKDSTRAPLLAVSDGAEVPRPVVVGGTG